MGFSGGYMLATCSEHMSLRAIRIDADMIGAAADFVTIAGTWGIAIRGISV
jgi:hypothetical protein